MLEFTYGQVFIAGVVTLWIIGTLILFVMAGFSDGRS